MSSLLHGEADSPRHSFQNFECTYHEKTRMAAADKNAPKSKDTLRQNDPSIMYHMLFVPSHFRARF